MASITRMVSSGADDAIAAPGLDYFDSTSAVGEIGNVDGTVVVDVTARFTDITIPQGATILSAQLSYQTSAGNYTGTVCRTRIFAIASDNAAAPSTIEEYNGLSLTSAYADWEIPAWNDVVEWSNSADLSTVIQEIVNRSGWVSGNAITLIHKDNGSDSGAYRLFNQYDGDALNAPKLTIEYAESWLKTKSITFAAITGLAQKKETWKRVKFPSVVTATMTKFVSKLVHFLAQTGKSLVKFTTKNVRAAAQAALFNRKLTTKSVFLSVIAGLSVRRVAHKALAFAATAGASLAARFLILYHQSLLFNILVKPYKVHLLVHYLGRRNRPYQVSVRGKRIGWEITNTGGSAPKFNALEQEYFISQ